MKVTNITSKLFTKILPQRNAEYTNISMKNTFERDVLDKIYEAKGMLDNYAKHERVQIDIYDPSVAGMSDEKILTKNSKSNILGLNIKDLKSGQIISRKLQIFGDKDNVIKETTTPVMVNCLEEPETQRIVGVKSYKEYNFLKYLYANIEEMVNSLKK